jgi:hypothetical protein
MGATCKPLHAYQRYLAEMQIFSSAGEHGPQAACFTQIPSSCYLQQPGK